MSSLYNRERAKQLFDFNGIDEGKKVGTDIDWFYDNDNRQFFWCDFKYAESLELSTGQRLAFERMTDACQKSGIDSWYLIGIHQVTDCDKDVTAVDCLITKYRHNGVWIAIEEPITLKAFFKQHKADKVQETLSDSDMELLGLN